MVTFVGTVIAIMVALAGILDHFMDFLFMTALVYPCIAGIIFADFLLPGGDKWVNTSGWRWEATVATFGNVALGYVTQYLYNWGIPAVQSMFFSLALYWFCAKFRETNLVMEKG